jgi:hypothetical protein
MAESLLEDANLRQHFQRACNRINYLDSLDFTDISALQNSWLNTFNSANNTEKKQLIYALLTIHQVKHYWKTLKPTNNDIMQERFAEQLTLAIGRFYSAQPQTSELHLPSFFNALYTIL